MDQKTTNAQISFYLLSGLPLRCSENMYMDQQPHFAGCRVQASFLCSLNFRFFKNLSNTLIFCKNVFCCFRCLFYYQDFCRT